MNEERRGNPEKLGGEKMRKKEWGERQTKRWKKAGVLCVDACLVGREERTKKQADSKPSEMREHTRDGDPGKCSEERKIKRWIEGGQQGTHTNS